jgi:glycosyltransferase involved in cell wall biosynthesis
MPKKALIFSFSYYPHLIGGAEVAVKEITDRMPVHGDDGIEFHMITIHTAGTADVEKIGNITLHKVGSFDTENPQMMAKYLFILQAFFKAVKLHRKYKYDFIWSIMANYAGFAAVLFKIVNPRVPFLLTLQEGDPISHIKHRVRYLHPLFKMIFTRANHVQAISHYLARFANDMGAKCPIDVVPNAVDVEQFSKMHAPSDLKKLKSSLGFSESDIVLITTSRLVTKNGIGDIIRSLELLPEDVKLVILGVGPLESELRLIAKESSGGRLNNRVVFTGYISHTDLPKYLKASDIFVRPSLSEGLGNSFLEAMAGGIPVVATTVGGIPDFLTDGVTGLFCKVNNPESIAECVKRLMSDNVLKDSIIQNALIMVREKYEWGIVSHSMRGIFDKMK